jgi:nucleotide-binding universal stress UspA family protein
MYLEGIQTVPIVHSVLHPTDFSEGSYVAFCHALKASLLSKTELNLLHIASNGNARWSNFPGIRETLERWGSLPKNSPKSDVLKLGINPSKVILKENDPVKAVLSFLKKNPADLIVLATHQHRGRVRWMHKSVAEPMARGSRQMTLFIPGESMGFVSERDGSVSLNRVLIPVADTPPAQPAVEAAARLVTRLGLRNGIFTLLHVSESAETVPRIRRYEVEGWEWQGEVRNGDIIETIVDTAAEKRADLIVMSTDGRNGFLDGLQGSHTERVLRQCSAPLLTIPTGSVASGYLS